MIKKKKVYLFSYKFLNSVFVSMDLLVTPLGPPFIGSDLQQCTWDWEGTKGREAVFTLS